MAKKLDLAKTLESLCSEDARARVVSLLMSQVDIPEGFIEGAIKFNEGKGHFESAAELAKKAKMPLRSIEFYERAEKFYKAAEICEREGLTERAIGNYRRAKAFGKSIILADSPEFADRVPGLRLEQIVYEEEARRFLDAAAHCKFAGMTERAIANLEKAGRYEEAGKSALDAGLFERAIKDYLQAYKTSTAIEIARNQEWHETAIDICEKAGKFMGGAAIAEEIGLHERAKGLYNLQIEALLKSGKADKAAETALTIGRPWRAIEIYEDAKMFDEGAGIADGSGQSEKAQELRLKQLGYYEEVGNFSEAAKYADSLGLYERAVDNYARAGLNETAIKLALEHGMHEKVIAIYSREGKHDEAESFAIKVGMPEKVMEFYIARREGFYYMLEGLAKKVGKVEEAIKMCANAGKYNHAARLSAKLCDAERAKQFYLREIEDLEKRYDFLGAAESARRARMPELAEMYKSLYEILRLAQWGRAKELIQQPEQPGA